MASPNSLANGGVELDETQPITMHSSVSPAEVCEGTCGRFELADKRHARPYSMWRDQPMCIKNNQGEWIRIPGGFLDTALDFDAVATFHVAKQLNLEQMPLLEYVQLDAVGGGVLDAIGFVTSSVRLPEIGVEMRRVKILLIRGLFKNNEFAIGLPLINKYKITTKIGDFEREQGVPTGPELTMAPRTGSFGALFSRRDESKSIKADPDRVYTDTTNLLEQRVSDAATRETDKRLAAELSAVRKFNIPMSSALSTSSPSSSRRSTQSWAETSEQGSQITAATTLSTSTKGSKATS
ncbi:hypothetical protein PG985_011616 [Apiospora marii]|uniref:uncharacterized protein n=1 Tax=Apiospora marii TaxID=335849 RepID=UPI00312FE39F